VFRPYGLETMGRSVLWVGLAAGGAGDVGFAAAGDCVRAADVAGRALVAGCVACITCAPASIAARKKDDPGEVVMDEFAAQALTFLAMPLLLPRSLSGRESFLVALAGFLLFRAFDIIKPWPIRKLERFPAGWGILADDLVAGAASAIVLYVGMRLWITA
jgi:phosphatidylglycerophosphatase A